MKNKLAIGIGIIIAIAVTAGMSYANFNEVGGDNKFTGTVNWFPNGITIGQQGSGGVTFFNGTIVNETTDEDGNNNPITFGDNVRVDGELWRVEAGGDNPLKVADTILPSSNNAYDLGASSYKFKDGYFTGTVSMGALGGSGIVSSDNIAGSAVTSAKIEDGAVATSNLADSAVTSAKINNGAVATGDLANSAVTSAKIADGAVNSAKIANGSIATADLDDGAVTGAKIANNTIDFNKVVNSPTLDADMNIESGTLFIGSSGGSYAGRVGIGTATPNTTIQVEDYINFDNNGNIHLSALGYQAGNAITGADNTLVGYQAGDVITSGTDNTALGDNALGATTTTAQNTAVGSGALAANTSQNNTAIGHHAMLNSAGGNGGNTAVGSKALDANTTGEYNIAIGYDALGATILSSSNTAIGYNAMAAHNGAGAMNVAIGRNALDASTGGTWNVAVGYNTLTTGTGNDMNVAVGYEALKTTTVDNLTAVGYQALTAHTNGANATAVGSGALDANTTGGYNTAVGTDSLGANVQGGNNTALGSGALSTLKEAVGNNTAVGTNALKLLDGAAAQYNVAIGSNALAAATDVSANVAIGDQALEALDGSGGAGNNTAIGWQAGNAATSGYNNVLVGWQAGLALETGDYNTVIGMQAGDNIIGGGNNTIIGGRAGNITSGDSNIIIGYDAGVPIVDVDNQLSIGNTIWGDLSNDYIAIGGTETPTDVILEINQSGTVPHLALNPIDDAPISGVSTGDIYMDTDGILYVRSTSAWAAMNTAADFSELIVPVGFEKEVNDGVRSYVGDIDAGDLIVINDNGDYVRSNTSYDSSIVGVESGDRGRFRLKEGTPEREEGQRQVGIMGHVLVNVSLENGPIKPGDSLTTSSLPGHAMKSTESGMIVGKALGSFDGSDGDTGKIEVLINPGWCGGM